MNYFYGMKYRPFSIGTQPKAGLVNVHPTTLYHDVIEYERKLTDLEVKQYELIFIKKWEK